MSSSQDEFCLQWTNFKSIISAYCQEAWIFHDVSLVSAEGHCFNAHQLVLSACSPFLHSLLLAHPPHLHPVLHLADVTSQQLQLLLNFCYHGEVMVNLSQINLYQFKAVAEFLKVKGVSSDIKEEVSSLSVQNLAVQSYELSSEDEEDVTEKMSDDAVQVAAALSAEWVNITARNEAVLSQIDACVQAVLVPADVGAGWRCSLCGKEGKHKHRIAEHIVTHHIQNHPGLHCEVCGNHLKNRRTLYEHKKYRCSEKWKKFYV